MQHKCANDNGTSPWKETSEDNKLIYKMFSKNLTDNMVFLGIEKIYSESTTKDLSDNIKVNIPDCLQTSQTVPRLPNPDPKTIFQKQVGEYWSKRHTRIKFVQFQRILEARCASKKLVRGVFICRAFTMLVCIICGSFIFSLYIKERKSIDGRALR